MKEPERQGEKLASYTFSMEKILDWRSDLEEEAKRKVSGLQQKWDQEDRVLQSLIQENIKIKNEKMQNKEIQSMRYNHYYKILIDEKIVQQKNLLDRLQAEIEQAKEELIQSHQNKKAMEKLKEKERAAVAATESRLEQLQLDEIATMNFKRRAL